MRGNGLKAPKNLIKLAYKEANKVSEDKIKDMEKALEKLGLPKDIFEKMSKDELKTFLDMAWRYLISKV